MSDTAQPPAPRRPRSPSRQPSGGYRPPREARIQHIAGLMRAMTWRHTMAEDLGILWGLTTSMVQLDSSESSRMIAREITEPDRILAVAGTRLENVILTGRDRDAVAAASVAAKLLGINAAVKLDVNLTVPLMLSDEWSALRRMLVEQIDGCAQCSGKVVQAIKAWEGAKKLPK